MKNRIKDKVLILDSETTGLANNDEIIELAWIMPTSTSNIKEWVDKFIADNLDITNYFTYTERFNPSVPINPHAFKVHGISKLKLLSCRKSSEVDLPEGVKYIVAHNAAFDYRMLGKPEGIELICTKTIVAKIRKLGVLTNDDDDGKDKLDVLITHYYPELSNSIIKPLHDAMGDCVKIILLLGIVLRLFPKVTTWEDLYNLQHTGKKK